MLHVELLGVLLHTGVTKSHSNFLDYNWTVNWTMDGMRRTAARQLNTYFQVLVVPLVRGVYALHFQQHAGKFLRNNISVYLLGVTLR